MENFNCIYLLIIVYAYFVLSTMENLLENKQTLLRFILSFFMPALALVVPWIVFVRFLYKKTITTKESLTSLMKLYNYCICNYFDFIQKVTISTFENIERKEINFKDVLLEYFLAYVYLKSLLYWKKSDFIIMIFVWFAILFMAVYV